MRMGAEVVEEPISWQRFRADLVEKFGMAWLLMYERAVLKAERWK